MRREPFPSVSPDSSAGAWKWHPISISSGTSPASSTRRRCILPGPLLSSWPKTKPKASSKIPWRQGVTHTYDWVYGTECHMPHASLRNQIVKSTGEPYGAWRSWKGERAKSSRPKATSRSRWRRTLMSAKFISTWLEIGVKACSKVQTAGTCSWSGCISWGHHRELRWAQLYGPPVPPYSW